MFCDSEQDEHQHGALLGHKNIFIVFLQLSGGSVGVKELFSHASGAGTTTPTIHLGLWSDNWNSNSDFLLRVVSASDSCLGLLLCVTQNVVLVQSTMRSSAVPRFRLTQTLVGVVGRRSPPGPVVEERFAHVTVDALRVVFTVTHQPSTASLHTLAGMAMTLTPG